MRFLIVAIIIILPCCASKDDVRRLEQEVARLQRSNEQLKKQYNESIQRLEGGINNTERQKQDWKNFAAAYDLQTRQKLYDNVTVSQNTMETIANLQTSCIDIKKRMDKHALRSEELKNLVLRYEEEARLSNVVQRLRIEREEFIQNIEELRRMFHDLKRHIRDVESENDQYRHQIGDIERNIYQLEGKVKALDTRVYALESGKK